MTSDSERRTWAWGILGTGKIAAQFTARLVDLPRARLAGVASRHRDRAERFAAKFSGAGPTVFESYATLCADPEIDVVYVATPTATHADLCRMALGAGKAVLCEKPFCRSEAEAAEIFDLARSRNLFAMEAMWMRFNPLVRRAKDMLQAGEIGDVRSFHAELGYAKDAGALGRAEEGRGARLAFGCYGVSLAVYLFGAPGGASIRILRDGGGAEETVAIALDYPSHVATVHVSEWATLANDVRIFGRRGSLSIGAPFIDTTLLRLVSLDRLENRSLGSRIASRLGAAMRQAGLSRSRDPGVISDLSLRSSGFRGEAEEVMTCLHQGLLESRDMPHSDTLLIHRLLESRSLS